MRAFSRARHDDTNYDMMQRVHSLATGTGEEEPLVAVINGRQQRVVHSFERVWRNDQACMLRE